MKPFSVFEAFINFGRVRDDLEDTLALNDVLTKELNNQRDAESRFSYANETLAKQINKNADMIDAMRNEIERLVKELYESNLQYAKQATKIRHMNRAMDQMMHQMMKPEPKAKATEPAAKKSPPADA